MDNIPKAFDTHMANFYIYQKPPKRRHIASTFMDWGMGNLSEAHPFRLPTAFMGLDDIDPQPDEEERFYLSLEIEGIVDGKPTIRAVSTRKELDFSQRNEGSGSKGGDNPFANLIDPKLLKLFFGE